MSAKFYPKPTPHGWAPRASVGAPMQSTAQLTSAGSRLAELGALLGDPDLPLLRARAALRDECEGPDSLAAHVGVAVRGGGR